jgi:hypothetical protein
MRLEALKGALPIGAQRARKARHIAGEDRGETAGRGHGSKGPNLRQTIVTRDYTTKLARLRNRSKIPAASTWVTLENGHRRRRYPFDGSGGGPVRSSF